MALTKLEKRFLCLVKDLEWLNWDEACPYCGNQKEATNGEHVVECELSDIIKTAEEKEKEK